MNTEDKIHAEKMLKNLFIGSQVDGLQFGISPGAIKIHFTNFHDSVDYDGQLYINIESKWYLFNKPQKSYPLNEDEFEVYSEKEEYERICKIRRQKVTDIQLGLESPHLIITLESGQIIFLNGFHDYYECWQAGVLCEQWLVVAAPGNEIATWAPDEFTDK
ncbi:hypothetical protein FC695_24200 [Bacillus cereus]|uniref:Uncharacterized protein n=1 Tax=Bacillus cereus TaxID=1396 RepID=A0A9X9A6L1_BACCE|nr:MULTISPECIES: hypothetical protein [Bacillus cereus group]MCM3220140.1 hypothetical protein [Bacillus cereus]MCU4928861.1 hypothetical protein [Bacillus cereus]OBW49193.1 hypothetical protein A9987_18540 [Bacillus cereus]OFC80013.1 hypothetical protein BTGOE1_15360 [Bacillus thuringiensis]OFC84189.1 hypothetical protein BTGOE2_30220 [Bacillus thuringiensis]